jgi:6-pyruvoyltetrahydropterin/6-carboxytetrahydropterin synthase
MPYRICKTFEIESGHILSKHPDRCQFPHGHSRRVEVVLEADTLDDKQMICDYFVIKETMRDYLDTFDHAMCINSAHPAYDALKSAYGERLIPFDDMDPTSEIMAQTIFDRCKTQLAEYRKNGHPDYPLRETVRVVKVRVWETSSSWAEYRE